VIVDTKKRSETPEIMDDFSLKGEELKDALDKIAKINQLLGGNSLTINGVKILLKKSNSSELISIVDVGCGNGDILRKLAEFGLQNNLNLELIGVDANQYTIDYAQSLSKGYSNIKFICEDVFGKSFSEFKYDIVLCTLTLHHFKNEEILRLLSVFKLNSRIGFVINDLQRSVVAYYLFQLLCFVFKLNKMSKEDGLTSILRGFKKKDLIDFSMKKQFLDFSIKWKWAFRYQWIVFS
jgi:2-polyprenyl-3-methyl-5-hydroxy-6-metoxy-1,4-benzoquinol methylase